MYCWDVQQKHTLELEAEKAAANVFISTQGNNIAKINGTCFNERRQCERMYWKIHRVNLTKLSVT